jgi:two-component system phosphate regulon response regulator PhoB
MKPLILICSPDYEFYLLLAQILNMGGLESSLVEGAEEALASVKSDGLVAVIIDYHSDAFRIGDLVSQIRETLADKRYRSPSSWEPAISNFISKSSKPA